MHRINTATATSSHQFTEGDPTTGEKATQVSADWLNTVQAELATLVEYNGGALDTGDDGQVLAQILALLGPALPRTGEIVLDSNPVERTGWVFFDDGTIGDANSGATTRANADCQALFLMYWNNYPNSLIPVSGGGRGSSAEADWGAGKTLKLPRVLGRALAVAGNGSGLTNRELGQYLGNETHTLSASEMPKHRHSFGGTSTAGSSSSTPVRDDSSGSSGYTHYTNYQGNDQPHNNMPPTAYVMARVKL